MTAYASEQTDYTVDVLSSPQGDGQSVDDAEQDATGTTDNDDAKDWRKSQKTWQEMAEKAKKGEQALSELQRLKEALGVKDTPKETVDPVKAMEDKLASLELKAKKAEWEAQHPASRAESNKEAWDAIVSDKIHLIQSGDLTFDDLWAIVRKSAPKSSTTESFESQSQNIGSVPSTVSSPAQNTHGIDPDVYKAMKAKGWTDKQIQASM